MNDKGQVTIFVIVAILIVLAVFFLVLINRNDVSLREQDFDNPEVYIGDCLRERANLIIESMLTKGGVLDSRDTVLYKGNQITYLCKNINNFEPCINQYPLYLSQMENEFEKNIKEDSEWCLASLKQELTKKNYNVNLKDMTVDAKFKPGVVEVTLNGDFYMGKGDSTRKFSKFDILIQSSMQDIGFVVNEIVSQEAKWCHFSNDGFMILYPEYDIRVYMMEDSTKIYTIKNKKSWESFSMAIRGCTLPAGLF